MDVVVVHGSSEVDLHRVARALHAACSPDLAATLAGNAKTWIDRRGGVTSSQYVLFGCIVCVFSSSTDSARFHSILESCMQADMHRPTIVSCATHVQPDAARCVMRALHAAQAPVAGLLCWNGVGCALDASRKAVVADAALAFIPCSTEGIRYTDACSILDRAAFRSIYAICNMYIDVKKTVLDWVRMSKEAWMCVPNAADPVFLRDNAAYQHEKMEWIHTCSLHMMRAAAVRGTVCNAYPRVCVVIATFNRWTRLLEAVRSVCWQTMPVSCIVIVDDASTDERYKTLHHVVQQYTTRGENVIVRRRLQNTKAERSFACPAVVRNEGMCLARETLCDFVAVLDDDDIWLPTKNEVQLRAMFMERAVASCSEGYYAAGRWDPVESSFLMKKPLPLYHREHFRRNVRRVCQPYLSSADRAHGAVVPHHLSPPLLRDKNVVIHSSFVCHQSYFPVYKTIPYGRGMDYLMVKELIQSIRIILYIDEPLVCYEGRIGPS
jgi:hypothetical protein